MPHESPLNMLVGRLKALSPLADADRDAILELPFTARAIERHAYIVRQGDEAQHSCLLMSGFLGRHKVVTSGARQIVSVHMAGDMVSMQNALLRRADHSVQALTDAEVALIPARAIVELAATRPAVAVAMWLDTLIDGAIFREWIINLGRRDASTRTAHLLCEFGLRQERAGLASRNEFDLPLTQSDLADALGLTSVHVNRTLKKLEQSGLISRSNRALTVSNWNDLRRAGDFDPAYLNVDKAEEQAAA